MAIIALQEIDTYKYLDFFKIEDLCMQYMGNQYNISEHKIWNFSYNIHEVRPGTPVLIPVNRRNLEDLNTR